MNFKASTKIPVSAADIGALNLIPPIDTSQPHGIRITRGILEIKPTNNIYKLLCDVSDVTAASQHNQSQRN